MDKMIAADKITMHIKEGVNKNICFNLSKAWDISLCFCIKHGFYEIANMLLESGVSAQGNGEPLNLAVDHGNVEMVKLLLKNGADPRSHKYQALKRAALLGNQRVVELLIGAMPPVSPWMADNHEHNMLYAAQKATISGSYELRDYIRTQLHLQLGETE